MANRHEMFKARLNELGMYDEDSDYDGMIGQAVEELSATFGEQGHSGMSAVITVGLFNKLMEEYNNPDSIMWKKETNDGRNELTGEDKRNGTGKAWKEEGNSGVISETG